MSEALRVRTGPRELGVQQSAIQYWFWLGWRSNASKHATHDQGDTDQTDDDARRQQHHRDAHRQAHDDQHEPRTTAVTWPRKWPVIVRKCLRGDGRAFAIGILSPSFIVDAR